MAESCIFCRIIAGEIPAQFVHKDDDVVAFRDISPRAPTHILVIPREHIESLATLTPDQRDLAGKLLQTAADIAKTEGIVESGYRVAANVGPDSGSEVSHLHFHVMGGKRLGPPT